MQVVQACLVQYDTCNQSYSLHVYMGPEMFNDAMNSTYIQYFYPTH